MSNMLLSMVDAGIARFRDIERLILTLTQQPLIARRENKTVVRKVRRRNIFKFVSLSIHSVSVPIPMPPCVHAYLLEKRREVKPTKGEAHGEEKHREVRHMC